MNPSESESSPARAAGLQVELGAKPARHFSAIWLVLVFFAVVVVTGATLIGWSPSPSLVPAPSPNGTLDQSSTTLPTITWSPNSIDVVLSPGETASRSITFTSSTDLTNVVIEPVSSLAPFTKLSPSTFSRIKANKAQAVTITITIPAGAALGGYQGTIHLRIGTQTFPQTLKVAVDVWRSFADPTLGIAFKFPPSWNFHSWPYEVYFTAPPEVGVLTIAILDGNATPQHVASAAIENNRCSAVDANDQPVDHVIPSGFTGVLYVLSCSAMTDNYHYVFLNKNGQLIDLSYHNDFDSDASEEVKVSTFLKIIRSLR